MYSHVSDPELGWWNLPVFEVPRAKFWARVHESVEKIASGLWKAPGRIVLMGEHGTDKEFREVVRTALGNALDVDVDAMLEVNKAEDTLYLAARGAAELAWRQEYWKERDGEEEGSIEL